MEKMLNKKARKRLLSQASAWRESGLSKAAYSKKIGISESKLSYWLGQYKKEGSGEFVELPSVTLAEPPPKIYEVKYPSGLVLKVSGVPLKELLKAVKDA